jgi:hypothetical protein
MTIIVPLSDTSAGSSSFFSRHTKSRDVRAGDLFYSVVTMHLRLAASAHLSPGADQERPATPIRPRRCTNVSGCFTFAAWSGIRLKGAEAQPSSRWGSTHITDSRGSDEDSIPYPLESADV